MTFVRRRLFAFAVVWLACQAGSLAAFLPQDCCPDHRQLAAKDCHENPTANDQCPMHQADGKACPMHSGAGSPGSSDSQNRPCAMRGTCNGPAAALATLLSIPGVLVDQSPVPVDDRISTVVLTAELSLRLSIPHDTPPPRA